MESGSCHDTGTHKITPVCPGNRSLWIAHKIWQVTILNADFEKAVRTARKRDFIYFDLPIFSFQRPHGSPVTTARAFLSTTRYSWAGVFDKLSKKEVQVMLSNSNVQEIADLYEGYTIETEAATRCINCNGKKRSGTSEIIVTNYDF
ncbi:MAG: DNA adenine methylase [Methanoregula sp.]